MNTRIALFVVGAAFLSTTGCLFGETPSGAQALKVVGLESRVPIRACGDAGERSYLQRLRCGDGTVPTVEREGNVPGEEDQRREGPIAANRVVCPDGTFRVFIQQTCWGKPTDRAPRGLRLLEENSPK